MPVMRKSPKIILAVRHASGVASMKIFVVLKQSAGRGIGRRARVVKQHQTRILAVRRGRRAVAPLSFVGARKTIAAIAIFPRLSLTDLCYFLTVLQGCIHYQNFAPTILNDANSQITYLLGVINSIRAFFLQIVVSLQCSTYFIAKSDFSF